MSLLVSAHTHGQDEAYETTFPSLPGGSVARITGVIIHTLFLVSFHLHWTRFFSFSKRPFFAVTLYPITFTPLHSSTSAPFGNGNETERNNKKEANEDAFCTAFTALQHPFPRSCTCVCVRVSVCVFVCSCHWHAAMKHQLIIRLARVGSFHTLPFQFRCAAWLRSLEKQFTDPFQLWR